MMGNEIERVVSTDEISEKEIKKIIDNSGNIKDFDFEDRIEQMECQCNSKAAPQWYIPLLQNAPSYM